jgi:hypothetical protein
LFYVNKYLYFSSCGDAGAGAGADVGGGDDADVIISSFVADINIPLVLMSISSIFI